MSRRGRGKAAATMRLIEAAAEIANEIQPCTVRAICYRLFVAGLIKSMSKGNTDKVSKQLVWAREQGLLPWECIVDETREAERISTWDEPEEIIRAAVRGYRKDYWSMQPRRVEVWSEKGTVRGTLAPVLHEFGVTFRVMHGYGSATALHDIAQETAANPKPLTVLYVGDWDPSGLHMSKVDVPRRLLRYEGTAQVERIALDETDVAPGTELPHFEAADKTRDPRHKWFVEHYGLRCWELDAMSPVVLRQRVEDHIRDLIDHDAWDHAVQIERAEVESMSTVLGVWRSISGQASKYSGRGLP